MRKENPMLCSSCHGQHFIIRAGQMMPCPECGGMGGIHCCDGLTEQPEGFASGCSSQVEEAASFSGEEATGKMDCIALRHTHNPGFARQLSSAILFARLQDNSSV